MKWPNRITVCWHKLAEMLMKIAKLYHDEKVGMQKHKFAPSSLIVGGGGGATGSLAPLLRCIWPNTYFPVCLACYFPFPGGIQIAQIARSS